jgi:hypothetical protein
MKKRNRRKKRKIWRIINRIIDIIENYLTKKYTKLSLGAFAIGCYFKYCIKYPTHANDFGITLIAILTLVLTVTLLQRENVEE